MISYNNKVFRILLLFISIGIKTIEPVGACGPSYPVGEEVRISLMKGDQFASYPFYNFTYSSEYFSDYNEYWGNTTESMVDSNISAWLELTEYCVTEDDLYKGLYESSPHHVLKDTTSSFYRYLNEYNRTDLKEYLNFLGNITFFDSRDPWNQYEKTSNPALDSILNLGVTRARNCTNKQLRSRYIYVTLRCAIADYRQDWCREVYVECYPNDIDKNDPVAWWIKAIYLDCLSQSVEKTVALSELFVHCHERQFWAWLELPKKVDWEGAYKSAETPELKRCVCILASIHQPYRSSKYLERLAQMNPRDPALEFLVFREINKLEDWVFSGIYMNMDKSTNYNDWYNIELHQDILATAQKEQTYAREVAQMLNAKGYGRNGNDEIKKWQLAYLHFIAGDHQYAYGKMTTVNTSGLSKEQRLIYLRILMLCKAEINGLDLKRATAEEIGVFEDAKLTGQNKWLYILAMALQRNHHPVESVLVMASLNEVEDWNNTAYWRSPLGQQMLYFDYYTDFEEYLSIGYSADELLAVVSAMKTLKQDYPSCLAINLEESKNYVDMALGAIFLREDNLELAELHFTNTAKGDWNIYNVDLLLEHNPFYTNFYRCRDYHISDSIRWNKASFVRQLRIHLHCMNQPNEPYRAYHAFQAAVGYFNMTRHGAAWQMRRGYLYDYEVENTMIDNDEYNKCLKAKQLFQKAAELAELEEFKALSLMMVARCETLASGKYRDPMYNKIVLSSPNFHPEYGSILAKYPEHYKYFMSTCHSFDEYFQCYALNGVE